MRIVISSGHGKYIRGASGNPVPPQLDEVDEARAVVNKVAELLHNGGVDVVVFHDNVSTTQSENLNRIVEFHNAQGSHDLDVSVHFNAYDGNAHGTECLYVTQDQLAGHVSAAISDAGGFVNRGAKYRSDLAFLNGTNEPAILIETCFCDNTGDSNLYHQHFDAICEAIAETISGEQLGGGDRPERPDLPERPERPPSTDALFYAQGRCSWFGGPDDHGVSASEGLAFFYDVADAPHVLLHEQPSGTSGLARRLDPETHFVACRWDYNVTPKEMLRDQTLKARVSAHGKSFLAYPADWGPHTNTGRVADLSLGLMEALGLNTDDEVEVVYPASAE